MKLSVHLVCLSLILFSNLKSNFGSIIVQCSLHYSWEFESMASRRYFYATFCCLILLGSWCASEEELDNVLDGKSSRSANFIEIHHHFLRSPEILLVKTVRDSLQCAQHCLVIKKCRSFNFGLEADNNGKHLCQLLPWNKFQHSGRYEPSSAFHHYRIAVRHACKNLLSM